MKKGLLLVLFAFALFQLSLGAPAKRTLSAVKQPDGTTLLIRANGDESFHYLTTEDGIPVIENANGTYCYARFKDGNWSTENKTAHNPDERSDEERSYLLALAEKQSSLQATEANIRKTGSTSRAESTRGSQEARRAFPTQGEMRFLILLVSFPDKDFSLDNPVERFSRLANETGYHDFEGDGSVRDYFTDQSAGVFSPQFDVVGPVKLSQNLAYYGANDAAGYDVRPDEMVKEGCLLAHQNFEIDFSDYDANNDGYVDCVYVIYAGYGESETKNATDIWPHQWSVTDKTLYNGKRIHDYACSNELKWNSPNHSDIESIGVLCHEFSHVLGLPDFYSTGSVPAFGLDLWSLMDYGCYNNNGRTPCNMTAYERHALGWGTLKEYSFPHGKVTLPSLSDSHEGIRISTPLENEYFILQNRRRTGWDKHLPAEGLMILHVDFNASKWSNNTINNDPTHPHMRLVAADNATPLYSAGETNYRNSLKGDLYPGTKQNTAFTNTSSPNAKLWSGDMLSKPITNIRTENGIVTFDFGTATGLERNISGSVVRIADRRLFIERNETLPVAIFSLTGQRVPYTEQSSGICSTSPLEPGLYIVQLGAQVSKIIIPNN